MRSLVSVLLAASASFALASLGACAGSDSGSELTPTGAGGALSGGKGGVGGGLAGSSSGGMAQGGQGGFGLGGVGGGAGAAGAGVPAVSAAEIGYDSKTALPSGQSILFNDWASTPNRVLAMTPDGATVTEVFAAARVWSMGVSHKVDRIAFSSADPQQQAHYGVTTGDAIQNTWMYDVATTGVELMCGGNVNDECHAFSPDDKLLYVCRRAGFADGASPPSYALARVDTSTRVAEQLTEPSPTSLALHPQPLPGDQTVLYTEVTLSGTKQSRAIRALDLATKKSTEVRAGASLGSVSADGTRYVFTDTAKGGLWVAPIAGGAAVQVTADAGTSAKFSPDGGKIVYLLDDKAGNCSHVMVVPTDGSGKGAPTKVRDCVTSKEFITQLAWVVR